VVSLGCGEFSSLPIGRQILPTSRLKLGDCNQAIWNDQTAAMAGTDKITPDQKGEETLQDSDEDDVFYDARFSAEEEAVRELFSGDGLNISATD
jgi:hypothetical protein